MKNILLFFPDCPFNEDNGAGIYFKNIIRFLNKYYDVNIFCLVGRYNINNEQKTFINSINNVTIIHPLDEKEYKTIQNSINQNKNWYNRDNYQVFGHYKRYIVIKKNPIVCISHWYILINKIINEYSIDYTFIRDSRFLFYYNQLCVYEQFKIKNVYFINVPPVLNHTYYNILTGEPLIYNDYKKYLKNNPLYESILITPCVSSELFRQNIYLPPMIFNNDTERNINTNTTIKNIDISKNTVIENMDISKNIVIENMDISKNIVIENMDISKNTVISFTGSLVDAQEIIQVINAFDRALTDKVLTNNFILNVTGKDMFTPDYLHRLKKTHLTIKNKDNIVINISKEGIQPDIIKNIIEKSILCIRLDTTREVISTKVLNYIKAKKPIILQNLFVHKFLFGNDYPFYTEKNIQNCENVIYEIFKKLNKQNINKAITLVEKAYNKVNDEYLYNKNLKLKRMLGERPFWMCKQNIKHEYFIFKHLKWIKRKYNDIDWNKNLNQNNNNEKQENNNNKKQENNNNKKKTYFKKALLTPKQSETNNNSHDINNKNYNRLSMFGNLRKY
tara:strand:- start:3200 stop:4885 length:1686 start_codon:yes stop_codon:yes gene_type:complete